MTRLSPTTYLEHIGTESARFRAALNGCAPGDRVPTCPDWDAADLLWHLTEVQDFWAWIVTHRPAGPDERTAPVRPASYAALMSASEDAASALVEALATANPADHAWSWADEQTVGFTLRRQAHEALIHRLDAEHTAGLAVSAVDRELAADGVEEALAVMFGAAPPFGSFAADGPVLRVDVADTGDAIWVQVGRFTATNGTDPASHHDEIRVIKRRLKPAAVVSGHAAALNAWLWRRAGDDGVTVSGEPDAYTRFRQVVDKPIT